jgi:LPXTG-motif cell wall-anchored protein
VTVIVTQNSSSRLSTGAIARIAVAAVLVGLAIIAGLVFVFIRRRRNAAAEADAVTAANIPDYFDTPRYNGSSPPVNVEGMSEIYTPNKDPNVAANGYYGPRKPDDMHESDGRPVIAQLYGSEPAVTELL